MARTIEDILARRIRALFLNARAAMEMAPAIADLMTVELGWNEAAKAKQLMAFQAIGKNYALVN
jgi:glycerol-3-phosphate dehydrogenase